MRTVEVIQDANQDVTMFWIFEAKPGETRRMLGVNFHCGIDFINNEYTTPDERLTKIYTDLAKGNDDYKERILITAIERWRAINCEATRRTIIEKEIDDMFDILMERVIEHTIQVEKEWTANEKAVKKSIKEALMHLMMSRTKQK
jgi:hypothetical protein